jgi:hypothetical protein
MDLRAILGGGMVEQGSWLDHPFHPLKWPRPERSGMIAILLAYVLLCAHAEAFILHEYADDISKISVKCLLFPFAPSCEKRDLQTAELARTRYHVITLYAGPKAEKRSCTCHGDFHYFGQPVKHIHWRQEPTCDSDWTSPREWTKVMEVDGEMYAISVTTTDLSGTTLTLKAHEGEYRYHCE